MQVWVLFALMGNQNLAMSVHSIPGECESYLRQIGSGSCRPALLMVRDDGKPYFIWPHQ
jgi:hypothetical protein